MKITLNSELFTRENAVELKEILADEVSEDVEVGLGPELRYAVLPGLPSNLVELTAAVTSVMGVAKVLYEHREMLQTVFNYCQKFFKKQEEEPEQSRMTFTVEEEGKKQTFKIYFDPASSEEENNLALKEIKAYIDGEIESSGFSEGNVTYHIRYDVKKKKVVQAKDFQVLFPD